jgi:exopolysaccharide biosynthesis polyprenyl glycosylphosphotransferase
MGSEATDVLPDGFNARFGALVRRNQLKLVLVFADVTAILLGFGVGMLISHYAGYHGDKRAGVWLAAAVIGGLWAMRSQGLFLSRVSAVRLVEITRLGRAVALLTGLMLLVDRVGHFDVNIYKTIRSSALTLVFLIICRGTYRSWLGSAREHGRHCRRVVLVGTDSEAVRLLDLFRTHRNLGVEVIGVIGDHREADRRGLNELWLGEVDKAEALVDYANASGVVVAPTALSTERLNDLIRHFHDAGKHVHLSTGISGIDARRLRSMPLAHEPLLYVEAPSLSKTQVVAKRFLDVIVASFAILVLSPVIAFVAVGIKLDDRGPILFSQKRVGRRGREFGVLKFRSMRVDAEKQLAQLSATNERQGPLFKMENDPRVTRIGRFLRDSSLDELPQLINVLRGEMSLVGPRPALASEVANFSLQLRAREQVMPGITGLWQVEARDNPSFEAYRRLDLFYVENWSITLDLLIIVGTMEQVASRLITTMWSRRKKVVVDAEPAAAEVLANP